MPFASPIGRVSLWPDWKSLRTTDLSHAAVQCRVAEDLTLYTDLAMESPFQRCPKSCLEKVVSLAWENSLLVLAGFEIEFYLIEAAESNFSINFPREEKTAPSRSWSAAAMMRGPRAKCVESCMIALERAGLEVEQGHAESSLNQFEISVAPLPAVAAADSLICAKEIIKEVATAHGFAALFLPKPFHSLLPTGLHFHLSIHHPSGDPEAIPLRDYVSSQTREKHSISKDVSHNFLAGILHRLSPIMAFSTPSDNSYLRLATEDVMGKYICWGRNNSSVPLNEISVGYWEIRSLDWTANIHLAMAAYISAGLLGIKEHQQLQCQDSGTLTYQLEPSARESLGIVDLLPQDFEQANLSLISRRYAGLQHYINEELIDLYVLVKEKERQYLSNLTDDDKLSLLFQHF